MKVVTVILIFILSMLVYLFLIAGIATGVKIGLKQYFKEVNGNESGK